MEVELAGLTDLGRKRDINEDYLGLSQKAGLVLVCDGMGGHAAGEVASRTAAETVVELVESSVDSTHPLVSPVDSALPIDARRLVAGVRLSNRRIYNIALSDPSRRGMGTTAVGLVATQDGFCCICHVGDSRAYRIRRGEIVQLTEDHSLIAELLKDQVITTKEAEGSKEKNVLTRALGIKPTCEVDVRIDTLEEGDIYLLCSDGLSGQVDDEQMRSRVLEAGDDLQLAARRLVEDANEGGGPDNITVGIMRVIQVPLGTALEEPVVKTLPDESENIQKAEDNYLGRAYPVAHPKAKKSRLLASVFGTIAAIAVVGAGGFFIVRGNRTSSSSVPSSSSGSAANAVAQVSLTIKSDPPGATVYWDGDEHTGKTPTVISELKPGSRHSLRVEKENYEPARVEVAIPSDRGRETHLVRLFPEVEVAVVNYPPAYESASLVIDKRSYGPLGSIQGGVAIPTGDHVVEIVDGQGKTIESKRFSGLTSGSVLELVLQESKADLRYFVGKQER